MSWWNRPGLKNFDGIVCDGAVRSGKTLCMSVGFFLWSMAEFDSQVFALCGRTVGSLRRNIMERFEPGMKHQDMPPYTTVCKAFDRFVLLPYYF